MKDLNLYEYKITSATYRGNNVLTLDLNQAIPFLDYLTQKDEPITFITRRERFICRYIEMKNGALYYDLRRKGGIHAITYEKIVKKVFSYKGYQCYIVFLPTGWRCGYVSISPEKSKNHEFIEYGALQCHGGITYSEDTCPIPCVQASDFWWIGFDCAHYGDGVDLNACEKYYGHSHFALPMAGHIRTVEFCEKELKNIVDQLEEA